MAAPLLLGAKVFLSGRPQVLASVPPSLDREVRSTHFLSATHRPAISISIEPAALAPCAEAEPPVVLPGYLLPVDGSEEPAHAGS